MQLDDIISNFDYLEEWEDRYRYLIELGRTLEILPEDAYTEENKVRGCASQVWLETKRVVDADGKLILRFRGDSDAHIVRGLVALVLALYLVPVVNLLVGIAVGVVGSGAIWRILSTSMQELKKLSF